MKRGTRGFILLLGLVVCFPVIAVVAAVAVPNLLSARLGADETAAIATLRLLVAAQAQLHQAALVDADRDGVGEYGGFADLSGGAEGRAAFGRDPPVLSGAFRRLDAEGEVARSGYLFRIFLPGPGGVAVGEPLHGFRGQGLDADACEVAWCAYAWPETYGRSGRGTFFVNQAGDVLATESRTYSGTGHGPAPDAAFQPPGGGKITGSAAGGSRGTDGNRWRALD